MSRAASSELSIDSPRPAGVSVFDGLPADVLDSVLSTLEGRQYPDGGTLITEGEHPREMFSILNGRADIFIAGRDSVQHPLNQLGVGGLLGELSLLTGEPASATVPAAGLVSVLDLGDSAFHALAASFPKLGQTLGAMLALKVARADRRQHLHITVVPPTGRFGDDQLVHTLDDLCRRDGHILIQSGRALRMLSGRRVVLHGRDAPRVDPSNSAPSLTLRAWSVPTTTRLGPDATGVVDVPALSAADEPAVRDGCLARVAPAGARLDWAACDLAGLKVGLPLGGGGLKGYAHIGVPRVLERSGVPVDYLAGSSVGGVVASLYALNHGPGAIADIPCSTPRERR